MKLIFQAAFLFLIHFAFSTGISAQTFLAPSAEWEERINIRFDQFAPWAELRFFLGDTTSFDGKQQQYVLNSRTGYDTLGYVREVGKKVYMTLFNDFDFLHDQPQLPKEFLLYDFSLEVGDTLPLRFYNERDTAARMKMLHFHVINQDSINTIAGMRKQLTLLRTYADSGWTSGQSNYIYGVCLGDTLKWIEGIGCTITPFYSFEAIACVPMGGLGPWVERDLLCHTKNGQLVYQPYGGCGIDVSLEEEQVFEVEIFPNPVRDVLKLKGTGTILKASVYDLQGILQMEVNQPSNETYIADLKPGVYLLVLENENGIRVKTKILKVL